MNTCDLTTYSRSVFKAILAGLGTGDPFRAKYFLDDQGARVDKDYWVDDLAWHPLCEIMAPGSPNPLDEPWLPFPFTARQLAALMVDGWGYFIRKKYGEWDEGPDEAELCSIGILGGKAREAITAAYQAYRDAVELAPKLDRDLADTTDALVHQYRREHEAAMEREKVREPGIADTEYTDRLGRVNDAVAAVGELMTAARMSADAAYFKWRRAVVQHLLLPVDQVDSEAFESQVLQGLSPEDRAQSIAQTRSIHKFSDTEKGRMHRALVCEEIDTERELRRWQLMPAVTPTDASIQDQKVADLKSKLANLVMQLREMDPANERNLPAAKAEPNWALLTTRDALVQAFAGFGLKREWFADLSSRRWLRDARKVKGQGQRGHLVEPMFCPFEVMNGMVVHSRTSKLRATTGWRLLELHFPKVYLANQVADPRKTTG